MIDAWKSFSRASWVRLVKLYVKIFLIVVALTFAWVAVLIPEYILIANNSRKVEELSEKAFFSFCFQTDVRLFMASTWGLTVTVNFTEPVKSEDVIP
ncbi:hypothetical protein EV127DRAFT_485135 [Xylaria flabelliformis]|nr:hypothetical protein EV127DRAFT_485135 [Xylaria flabelliformis]